MFNHISIPPFLKKNIYLLVGAAWLVTLSFLINNYWSSFSSLNSVKKDMNSYVQNAETDFIRVVQDTIYRPLYAGRAVSEEQSPLTTLGYYVFFYKSESNGNFALRYWNTQTVLPDSGILQSKLKAGFAQLANGFYVWNKVESAGTIAICLVPVKWNYIVTNDYLKNSFVNSPRLGDRYDIFPGVGLNGTIKSVYGVPLFYLVEKNVVANSQDNMVSVSLRIIAILMLLLFVHLCAAYLAETKSFVYGLLFLAGAVLFLRTISYLFPLHLNLRQLELFDPTIYGSGFVLRSLGDLLINTLLIVWVIMFIRHQLATGHTLGQTPGNRKWWLLGGGCLAMLIATFTGVNIVRSLVSDSQISFDVINFFSLNIYSLIGFVILCCIAVGYYFLCKLVLHVVKPFFNPEFAELYLCTTVLGLILLTFNIGNLERGIELYALAWLLLTLFLLNSHYVNRIATRIVSSKLIFWIFFFSISMTVLMVVENNQKELRNRTQYAEVLATKTDPASQSMLNSMLTDFRLDFFSQNFDRLKGSYANKFLKDSLINNNFSGYTNRYDTRIYSFDAQENAFFNDDNASYNQLNSILNTQAKANAVKGLFYYDESYDRFNYISKKVINDFSGNFLGTIFILVSPKTLKNDMLYPELFSKGSNTAIENSSTYAFAIYIKGKIVSSHNDYPFATSLPPLRFEGQQYLRKNKGGYDELWYQAGPDKFIVIAKESGTALESITLFSYFFCAFLFLTAVFWVLTVFVRSRLDPEKFRSYWQWSIRNQIQGIIIIISALSFVVIGVATILFFISRYQSNNQEKLSRAIQIMKTQVGASLSVGWQLTDSMLMPDRAAAFGIEKDITSIAEIHGVDINLYDLDGNLKFASLPLPYTKGIVSTKMNPVAFHHMSKQKEIQFFQQESIGNLVYASSYVPVFDAAGNAAAYINIPYFTSESKLQQEIANFLVTIINLNAFIFLMAGIVALFITNRITGSFALISEKMKRINLGKINEAIQWNRKDEIGSLVKEYNKMLAKLDESAAALAKTEREGAWREMAKQVAHEIKNPLTPMKLSMQFLQRSIETNAPNVKALTASVANTMVEQIDHLSNIASEFSQFANIENATKELLDINEALLSIKALHKTNEQITIEWNLLPREIWVHADKTHLNRLFTNLVLNALQSVPEGTRPKIAVDETIKDGSVLICVKDNGGGIAENIQQQIFTPNFTTKTSGTGLGLAMCKRIAEQMNGQIWFETSETGTRFFVQLPLSNA